MMFHCNSKIIGKIFTSLLIITLLQMVSFAETCVYSSEKGKYCYETKPVNTVNLVTPTGKTYTIMPKRTKVITSGVVSHSFPQQGKYNFEGNGYNFVGGYKFEGGLNYNGNGYNFDGHAYKF